MEAEEQAEKWLTEIHPEYAVGLYEFQLKDTQIFPGHMFSESVSSSLSSDKWWQVMNMKQNKKTSGKKLPDGFCSFLGSIHSCPASSAAIERLFSSFGLVWNKMRNRLGSEKAEKLVKIYKYLNVKGEQDTEW